MWSFAETRLAVVKNLKIVLLAGCLFVYHVQVDAWRRVYDSPMVTKCTSLPSYWVAVVGRTSFVGVANLYAYRILQTILL